jgi:hypothetical protein
MKLLDTARPKFLVHVEGISMAPLTKEVFAAVKRQIESWSMTCQSALILPAHVRIEEWFE